MSVHVQLDINNTTVAKLHIDNMYQVNDSGTCEYHYEYIQLDSHRQRGYRQWGEILHDPADGLTTLVANTLKRVNLPQP